MVFKNNKKVKKFHGGSHYGHDKGYSKNKEKNVTMMHSLDPLKYVTNVLEKLHDKVEIKDLYNPKVVYFPWYLKKIGPKIFQEN